MVNQFCFPKSKKSRIWKIEIERNENNVNFDRGRKALRFPCNQFRGRCGQGSERLHRGKRLYRVMVCRSLGRTEISEWLRQRLGTEVELFAATDADREGECIFRYVYNMARCRKPVKRLWVSSLEESAIRKALTNMKPMSAYDCLFDAGYARAKADWLVGMNGSRLFSVRYGGKLNIGRVQTPTLAMIVQRDHDVEHFVKQKYFTADLNCGDFILSSARIDDEANADTLVSACDSKTVTICSVKREVKTEKAPKLYDLTTLQREANKAYGYTAQQTLDYTQSLYEGKLVTYPRTDSQYLSDDMAQTAFDVLWLCDNIFGFAISHTPDISKVNEAQ